MRCVIVAPGSRGDVQPLIVLAGALQRAGIDVRFATHRDFEVPIRESGAEFFPMSGRSASFFGGAGGRAVRDGSRKSAEKFSSFFDRYLGTFVRKTLEEAWVACQDADFIIGWPWVRFVASLAEKLRVPTIAFGACPLLYFPTMAFPNPYQGPPHARYGPLYNRWSWRWALSMTQVAQTQVDRWRQEVLKLPLQPWREELRALRRLPHILGYSAAVLPKPADWPATVHVTGWWFAEQGAWQPPPELEAFLAAGKTPIGIGFSSQISSNAGNLTAIFDEALARTGNRAVMITGFGGLKPNASDRLFPVATIPYSWLLPRVAAMVHQGGSGSTGDTLRAGVPSFAVPFGYDQFLWANRIARIGVAAPPVLSERMTVETVVDAIRRVTEDDTMRRRAAAVGERIRAEDGVGNALRVIEQVTAPLRRIKGEVVARSGIAG